MRTFPFVFSRLFFVSFFLFSFFSLFSKEAKAEFQTLIPCQQSPAFEKRLTSEVKKLENRLKFYSPESKEATGLIHEIDQTKARFDRYGKSHLLCGKEGFPRVIATGQWDHVNEFILPGILFLYISGWIGWVGRKYLQIVSQSDNSFEKEIIIEVPLALTISTSGFLWPVEAWKEFQTGQLVASEEDITVSPR